MRQSQKKPLDSRTRTSTTTSNSFDLKFIFSRVFSKNRHPGKLQFTLSPERLSWLFLLWKVKPSPDCKLIKRLKFLFLFPLLSTFLLKPDLSRTTAIAFSRQNDAIVYARAPLRLFSVFFLFVLKSTLNIFLQGILDRSATLCFNNFHHPCWLATDKD